MTRRLDHIPRHPQDATCGQMIPGIASITRQGDRGHHQPRLTRWNNQASPPMTILGGIARPTGLDLTRLNHRIQVRADGLAARVMGAS